MRHHRLPGDRAWILHKGWVLTPPSASRPPPPPVLPATCTYLSPISTLKCLPSASSPFPQTPTSDKIDQHIFLPSRTCSSVGRPTHLPVPTSPSLQMSQACFIYGMFVTLWTECTLIGIGFRTEKSSCFTQFTAKLWHSHRSRCVNDH